MEIFIDEPDYEWLIMDPPTAKCTLTQQAHAGVIRPWGLQKGLNTKIHLTVDMRGMPFRAIVTSATAGDCTGAFALIDGQSTKHLLADKGDDSDAIIKQAINQGTESQHKLIQPNISPRRRRKKLRQYNEDSYKLRHLIENAFSLRWQGIATRYAKHGY